MFVREADLSYDLGPASARPYLDLAVLERALVDSGADAVVARLGLRRRGPRVRRPVRQARRHLHRPERRRDAPARRQDRLEADRRGGRRARGAVEPRRGRLPRGRAGLRRGDRLPADAQGDRPAVVAAGSGWSPPPADLEDAFQRTSDEALRAFGNGTVFLERLVTGARHVEVQLIADRHGTAWAARRTRLLDPAPQPEGHRGVLLAVAQRRAERGAQGVGRAARPGRRVRRRRHRRVPLPPRRAGPSPSSRSTPGSRSSTRSPRSPPASTWSRHRSTSRRAAASRARSRPRSGTRSRPGSTPRTPTATSLRRPAASSTSTCPPAPASGSTPASPRATPSRPTSTR